MEDTELKKFEHTNEQVGIDLGVKDFVITSDGEVFENKHFFKAVLVLKNTEVVCHISLERIIINVDSIYV